MDYEKKYNEALERAKYVLHTVETAGCAMHKDLLTEIFPELRESEDERIRKWLVDYFSSIKETVWIHRDISCEQILEWLEKQKEPTTEELYAEAGTTEKEYIANTMKMVRAMREKQKEQKPAEKQDYSGLNDLERAIHRGFLCAGVENVPVGIIKDTAAECMAFLALIEPKPAEWSEEDETHLGWIIECFVSWKYQVPEFADHYQSAIDWLKSLRPSWKPSEEQMNALNFAITYMFSTKANPTVLRDLYNDLLKLK